MGAWLVSTAAEEGEEDGEKKAGWIEGGVGHEEGEGDAWEVDGESEYDAEEDPDGGEGEEDVSEGEGAVEEEGFHCGRCKAQLGRVTPAPVVFRKWFSSVFAVAFQGILEMGFQGKGRFNALIKSAGVAIHF